MKPTKHPLYTAITKKIFHYRRKLSKNKDYMFQNKSYICGLLESRKNEAYICGLLESRSIIREHLKKGSL